MAPVSYSDNFSEFDPLEYASGETRKFFDDEYDSMKRAEKEANARKAQKEYGVSIAVDALSLKVQGASLLESARSRVTTVLEQKMSDMGYPPGTYILRIDRVDNEDFGRTLRIYASAVVDKLRAFEGIKFIINPAVVGPTRDEQTGELIKDCNAMDETLIIKRNILIGVVAPPPEERLEQAKQPILSGQIRDYIITDEIVAGSISASKLRRAETLELRERFVMDGRYEIILKFVPIDDSERIFLSGLLMAKGMDYNIQGNKVSFRDVPPSGSVVVATYRYSR